MLLGRIAGGQWGVGVDVSIGSQAPFTHRPLYCSQEVCQTILFSSFAIVYYLCLFEDPVSMKVTEE